MKAPTVSCGMCREDISHAAPFLADPDIPVYATCDGRTMLMRTDKCILHQCLTPEMIQQVHAEMTHYGH